MKLCNTCSTQMPTREAACFECGGQSFQYNVRKSLQRSSAATLEANVALSVPAANDDIRPERKRRGPGLLVWCGIILAVLILIIGYFGLGGLAYLLFDPSWQAKVSSEMMTLMLFSPVAAIGVLGILVSGHLLLWWCLRKRRQALAD